MSDKRPSTRANDGTNASGLLLLPTASSRVLFIMLAYVSAVQYVIVKYMRLRFQLITGPVNARMGKATVGGARRAALGELTNVPGVAVNSKVTRLDVYLDLVQMNLPILSRNSLCRRLYHPKLPLDKP